MNRTVFNQTLEQAIGCAIVFSLIVFAINALPHGGLIWSVVKVGLILLLVYLNGVMLIGFTSLQYDITKTFYACVIPIYPLYLSSQEIVLLREWWQYFIFIIPYVICYFLLSSCFSYRLFTRSVECIAIVLSVFSSPYLYSAIF
ncbi:hypothetical protein [Alteromonas sp. 14N.309.X.WAT.G.H12]|uniref:hypothetical protein n=1 Tax=Alteromonas sp. 14N.309.X.WAT.G.H12 TaxID=3120824 RepID=UPI002FD3485E